MTAEQFASHFVQKLVEHLIGSMPPRPYTIGTVSAYAKKARDLREQIRLEDYPINA